MIKTDPKSSWYVQNGRYWLISLAPSSALNVLQFLPEEYSARIKSYTSFIDLEKYVSPLEHSTHNLDSQASFKLKTSFPKL